MSKTPQLVVCAFLMTLLTVSCLAAPAARADDEHGIAELMAIQQAFIDRDYEKVFRIVLPSMTHGSPEYRMAEAEFAVRFYLLGGLEMLQADDQSGILWLRSDLSDKLPVDERISAGMIWIRRAAYHGSKEGLDQLSRTYRLGDLGVPQDDALADCFEGAISDRTEIESCRELERIHDAARERVSRLMSGQRLSPH